MMTGDPPFYARDTNRLYKMIMERNPKYPKFLTKESVSILKGLMNRDSSLRLGSVPTTMFKIGGVDELKKHCFFIKNEIDFNEILQKKLTPPYLELRTSSKQEKLKEKLLKKGKNLIAEEQQRCKQTNEFKHKAFNGFSYINKPFLNAVTKNTDISTIMSSQTQVDLDFDYDELEMNLIKPLPSEEETKKYIDFDLVDFELDTNISTEDLIQNRLSAFNISS